MHHAIVLKLERFQRHALGAPLHVGKIQIVSVFRLDPFGPLSIEIEIHSLIRLPLQGDEGRVALIARVVLTESAGAACPGIGQSVIDSEAGRRINRRIVTIIVARIGTKVLAVAIAAIRVATQVRIAGISDTGKERRAAGA